MSETVAPSAIIHRLKNHIAIVVGFSELLLSECAADDPKRDDIAEVLKAAQAAMAMMPEVDKCVRS